MPAEVVEFSAKIPKDLYERFKGCVPHYGGTQWFINSAVAEFVNRCEEQPLLKDTVASSVEAMLQLNRQLKEAEA
jgi:hypothetical protein